MGNIPVIRSINEPHTTRQSFTPTSINEPPVLPAIDMPSPTITSIEPTEAAIGDETFTLYVTGENFFAGTVLNFAGYDEPTTHNEDGTVSTIINMDVWKGADVLPVYVHNGEKTSNEVEFTFTAGEETGTALEATDDPDDLEDEIEQAEEEGEFKSLHRGRPTTTLSNKRSKAARKK